MCRDPASTPSSKRLASAREIHDAKLVTALESSFKASDRTYDARRVWRDVPKEDWPAGFIGSNT